MRKQVFLAIVIFFSVGSIAAATFVAQRAAQKAKAAQKTPAAQKQTGPGATPQALVTRQPDPNRAPQNLVDDALFTNEDFFGVSSSIARPYNVALERVRALSAQYPKDSRLHLQASRLAERLSKFDVATSEMAQYVDLKKRTPDALKRLVAFYHNRAMWTDEVKSLQELARALPVNQRAAIYKTAANIVRSRTLKEFKPADFFAELVAADPNNVQPVKNYVEELYLAKQNKEALDVLVQFQPRFPSELAYFLKTRAQIIENSGDRKAAEEVYSTAFDANWPRTIASDYYDLLRRFGRYRTIRRNLQEKVKAGAADLDTVARLFGIYAYENNNEQAAQLMRDLEARRAGTTTRAVSTGATQPAPVSAQWSHTELSTVAAMLTSIGQYDQASRYLYTLYLVGGLQPGSETREDALYQLFGVMIDAAGSPTRMAAGDLSLYKDIAEVDQNPGVINGVLSLILADYNIASEFLTQEKTAAGYFNRAFAYRIFTSFKQEFPQSKRLGNMYLAVVNVFSSLGEHQLAIEAAKEFRRLYPNSPKFAEVTLRMADSYVALKDRTNERILMLDLLDRLARSQTKGAPLVPVSTKRWAYDTSPAFDKLIDNIRYTMEAYSDTYDPTQGGDSGVTDEGDDQEEDSTLPTLAAQDAKRGPTYNSVLERMVASFAADERKTETVAFFWNEIKKHPREEGLYERFLNWLGGAELINDQLKAYTAAIRQFDNNTWYHRLARWHVRQKRGQALTRYARQLMNIFDEDEITQYLIRFAGYGTTVQGDSLAWDRKLAYDLYSYAHNKFPRNLVFVRGMLTYFARDVVDQAEWAKLSAQYYFADRSIRDPYLAWLSRDNKLRDRYSEATRQAATGLTYKVFAADAAMWLSHHDQAIDAYRQLVQLYPGEKQYADRLADLTRSFGENDNKLFEESATTLAQMGEIYPTDHSYRIKAGEVYAELGDFKRAGEQWEKLIQLEPAERETYLEVATVYWDYYQYDQAIKVFQDLRRATGDNALYAYRMGAVYEGKGDMDAAIGEYVKVLNEPGAGRDTVAKRLAQLSRRKGLAEKIVAAYQRAHSANPKDWQLVIGYAVYQAERDHQADALALLRSEVDRANDVAFLETVRDIFRWIIRPDDERQVLARLSQSARDEREAMMYLLQQAAFLERNGKGAEAISIIDKLVADYPTNVGVIEEAAQFYWRAKMTDRALALYKQSLDKARGPNRRALTLQYARHQVEAGKLADGEATLKAFYSENRSDMEVFNELAKTLGTENKLVELAALYDEAFKDARESGLAGEEFRSRVAELRAGMFATLDSLGKHTEALDQYIEVINNVPEDADKLATAVDYAEKHNLIDRLVGYYEKLSKESNKNYRWQLVLGRMYERRGNLAGASDQYRGAVANEPQKSELRFTLASVLARQRRFDEAIGVLRDGWTLSGRDPSWLVEIARLQVLQGKRDEAIQTIRQALAAKQNASAEAQFALASQMASWGLHEESARVYGETFTRIQKTLKDEIVYSTDVKGYVQALMRSTPPATVYQTLEQMRVAYQALTTSKDTDSYKASNIVTWIDEMMRTDFGRGVIDYGGASETAALASAIQKTISTLALYSDGDTLRRYLGIARGANLVNVEEQIQSKLRDLAINERARAEQALATAAEKDRVAAQTSLNTAIAAFQTELRALVSFYNRHAAYVRGAELLAAEYARDPYKDRFDYQNQMALEYRLTGDRTRELDALRRAYQSASGDLVMQPENQDWINRYLTLLYTGGLKSELERLAGQSNPHQFQLINFLIERGEKQLAQTAIASIKSKMTDAWVASRSAEVGLFMKDTSAQTEAFFKRALDVRPIGQMLHRRVDTKQVLVGDDWYVAARNYGYWLGLTQSREGESRNFVIGEVEGHPSNARAQLELAAYYLDHKDTAKATEHVQLADELSPGSHEVIVLRGSIALAKGDRKAALDIWNTLMTGRVSTDDANTYLRVMADNGFFREALTPIEDFMLAFVNRKTKNEDTDSRVEAIKPLIREITARAASDTRLLNDVAAFFHTAIASMPGNTSIGRMLINEELLPEPALASIYRTIHQRLSDQARAVFGTSEYENGYYGSSGYIYPARELASWRRVFLDYLIRTRSFDEARLLVATIRQEQSDLELALEERGNDVYTEEHYEWLPLASALIELRAGGDSTKAMAELRTYCGLDEKAATTNSDILTWQAADENARGQLHQRCLKAYALLVAEKKETEADALLYDSYTRAVSTRFADEVSLAGLAEIEARRGRTEEAVRLLKRLVERSSDSLKALHLAAEASARIKRYNDAVEFRQQIALANPADSTNRLELARAMQAAGRGADAITQIASLTSERTTSNSIRAQAAEVVGEVVRANPQLAQQASAIFDQRIASGDAGATLARASISEATGKPDEARGSLSLLTTGPLAAVGQMKLGIISLAAGREADAVKNFEQAIYLDADGLITDTIAFRATSPRVYLIQLYSRASRDAAAIELAGGDDSGRRSYINAAINGAIDEDESESVDEEQAVVAFEPSVIEARARTDGLQTLGELNTLANAKIQNSVLAALVESAARLGQYDRAIAMEKVRAAAAEKADERAAIEKRLAEIVQASYAVQKRAAEALRIDGAMTNRSIYASRFL